jgi:hypothetical protein
MSLHIGRMPTSEDTETSLLSAAEDVTSEEVRRILPQVMKEAKGEYVWFHFRSRTGDQKLAHYAIQAVCAAFNIMEQGFANAGHHTWPDGSSLAFIGFNRREFLRRST